MCPEEQHPRKKSFKKLRQPVVNAEPPVPLDVSSSSPTPSVMDMDWSDQYVACPHFQTPWLAIHTPGEAWPPGMQLLHNKLYSDHKLCIPTPWSNLSFKLFTRMLVILLQGGCSRNSHTGFCYHPTFQWCPYLKISPDNVLSVRVLHPLIGLPMAEFSLFPFQRN